MDILLIPGHLQIKGIVEIVPKIQISQSLMEEQLHLTALTPSPVRQIALCFIHTKQVTSLPYLLS